MKKKLVVVAMLLFAICFTGFAKEAITAESSQYIAKESEEKEYTFVVLGKIKVNGKWEHRKERFVIIDKSLSSAQGKARKKFISMYHGYTIDYPSITITCESTNNACQL